MVNKYPMVEAATRYTLVLGGGGWCVGSSRRRGPPAWEAKQLPLVWSTATNQHQQQQQTGGQAWRQHRYSWRGSWRRGVLVPGEAGVGNKGLTDCDFLNEC